MEKGYSSKKERGTEEEKNKRKVRKVDVILEESSLLENR